MDIECTCSALRMAARRLSQAHDAAPAPEGLTVSQYAVPGNLATWDGEAPPAVTELAGLPGLDRTTLAHNLRPLQRDGPLAAPSDPRDSRLRRVELTAGGRAKRDRCVPLWRAAQERFDESFGAERARALRSSLVALARHTEAAPAAGRDRPCWPDD